MPLYDYKCAQCGKISEVRHGFSESWDAPCPTCGGTLTRVFNPAPIVFKGSGFYVTDSRKSASTSSKPAEAASSESKSTEAKPDKSETKTKPPSGDGKATEPAA